MRGTTIARVAEEAGVGVGTVSRVLNGSPSVSEDTRRRVLEAIATLDYQPSAVARALSTGRRTPIGVVAPFFTQPSVIERLRGVARTLAGEGWQLILFDVEQPASGATRSARSRYAAASTACSSISLAPTDREARRLQGTGVPIVLLDRQHDSLPSITIDDQEGGRLAAEHLLALGHRAIAFLGDEEQSIFGFDSSANRRVGFEAAAGTPRASRSRRSGSCAGRTAARPPATRRPSCWRRIAADGRLRRPPTSRRSGCWRRRRRPASRCPRSSRSSASTTWRPRVTRAHHGRAAAGGDRRPGRRAAAARAFRRGGRAPPDAARDRRRGTTGPAGLASGASGVQHQSRNGRDDRQRRRGSRETDRHVAVMAWLRRAAWAAWSPPAATTSGGGEQQRQQRQRIRLDRGREGRSIPTSMEGAKGQITLLPGQGHRRATPKASIEGFNKKFASQGLSAKLRRVPGRPPTSSATSSSSASTPSPASATSSRPTWSGRRSSPSRAGCTT